MRSAKAALMQLNTKILLIEDDAETCAEISGALGERGYAVEVSGNGAAGLTAARSGTYDVLIVDRLLPELEGLAVIETLRAERVRTPVLVLSALGAVDDRIRGLKAGGDDYLTKPFAIGELAARIEALLRRPVATRATVLQVGPLSLDLIDRKARRGERVIELLPREFKLLEYLMRRPDQRRDARHDVGGRLELSISAADQSGRCPYRQAAPEN